MRRIILIGRNIQISNTAMKNIFNKMTDKLIRDTKEVTVAQSIYHINTCVVSCSKETFLLKKTKNNRNIISIKAKRFMSRKSPVRMRLLNMVMRRREGGQKRI